MLGYEKASPEKGLPIKNSCCLLLNRKPKATQGRVSYITGCCVPVPIAAGIMKVVDCSEPLSICEGDGGVAGIIQKGRSYFRPCYYCYQQTQHLGKTLTPTSTVAIHLGT